MARRVVLPIGIPSITPLIHFSAARKKKKKKKEKEREKRDVSLPDRKV